MMETSSEMKTTTTMSEEVLGIDQWKVSEVSEVGVRR
jgi:hypothetical protein